ncbi:MAG: M16 family metallopeptidase [Caldisericia bacterium]
MSKREIKFEIHRYGSKIIFERNSNYPSFSTFVLVRAGSNYENKNNNGYSHFIEHLVFKGTNKRNYYDIPKEVEGIGCDINAYTGSEYTGYYIRGRDIKFYNASDVLFDLIQNATFPENEIEKEKQVVIQEYYSIEDSPEELSLIELKKAIWNDTPFAYDTIGKIENIVNSNREKLYDFYNSYYDLKNLIISIYGNLEYENVINVLNEKLNKNNSNKTINIKLEEPVFQKDIKIKNKETKQMHVSIGFQAPSVVSDRYHRNLVLLNIIGGGMSSRLFQKIRENLGLVYAIYSFNLSNNITGANVIYFASSKENLPKVLEEIKKEINNMKKNGIKNDEIERSKEFLIGNYLLRLENSLARSERNAVSFFRKGYIEDIEETIKKIQSVRQKDIYEELEQINYNEFGYGVTGEINEDEFKRFL